MIYVLTGLAISLLLILKASWLALRVFPREETLRLDIDPPGFQAILFSVVGVYFVLEGIRGFVGALHVMVSKPSSDTRQALEYLLAERWNALVTSLANVALGIGLFFGSRGLANLWRRYRYGAVEPRPAESPPQEQE